MKRATQSGKVNELYRAIPGKLTVYGEAPDHSRPDRAQTQALLRGAPGTYVPTVAIRALEIPPMQPLTRDFSETGW